MTTIRFDEYIAYLRNNIGNLVEYKKYAGQFNPSLDKIQKDLFNDDPFVVYGASINATNEFSENTLYH